MGLKYWPIGLSARFGSLNIGKNYDITPPSKVQHPDAQWNGLKMGCLWVGVVELSDVVLPQLQAGSFFKLIISGSIKMPKMCKYS